MGKASGREGPQEPLTDRQRQLLVRLDLNTADGLRRRLDGRDDIIKRLADKILHGRPSSYNRGR